MLNAHPRSKSRDRLRLRSTCAIDASGATPRTQAFTALQRLGRFKEAYQPSNTIFIAIINFARSFRPLRTSFHLNGRQRSEGGDLCLGVCLELSNVITAPCLAFSYTYFMFFLQTFIIVLTTFIIVHVVHCSEINTSEQEEWGEVQDGTWPLWRCCCCCCGRDIQYACRKYWRKNTSYRKKNAVFKASSVFCCAHYANIRAYKDTWTCIHDAFSVVDRVQPATYRILEVYLYTPLSSSIIDWWPVTANEGLNK